MNTLEKISFLGGKKLSQLMPFLEIVAREQKLRLNRMKEFQMAVRIFSKQRRFN